MEILDSSPRFEKRSEKAGLKRLAGLPFMAALLCLSACSGVDTFTHRDADMLAIKGVVVVPFANHTQERLAGEKMTSLFVTELLINTALDVVEPGETLKVLSNGSGARNSRGSDRVLGLAELKQLGEKTGANTIILGAVDEYKIERSGQVSFPIISMTVRAVDVETGKILWMCSVSESGKSTTPIVEIGTIHTLSELGQKVCRKIAGTLRVDH